MKDSKPMIIEIIECRRNIWLCHIMLHHDPLGTNALEKFPNDPLLDFLSLSSVFRCVTLLHHLRKDTDPMEPLNDL